MERELLEKVAVVLTRRYDCQVRFIMVDDESPIMIPTEEEDEIVKIVVRNHPSEMIISRYGILFPIRFYGAIAAVGVFKTAETWLPNRIEQVRHQLDLVMNGISNLEDKSPRVEVVPDTDDRAPLQTTPILVEATADAPTREFAIELHNISQRQFFISLTDLDATTLKTARDFQELGSMTLYIPDITKVPLNMQRTIAEFIQTEGDQLQLKFVAISHSDIRSLVQLEVIDLQFASAIQGGYLKWPAALIAKSSVHEVLEQLMSRPDSKGVARLRLIPNTNLH